MINNQSILRLSSILFGAATAIGLLTVEESVFAHGKQTWICEGLLQNDDLRLIGTDNLDEMDKFWSPDSTSFSQFSEVLPAHLRDAKSLAQLANKSGRLHGVFVDLLNSLDTDYDRLWRNPTSPILINNLYKVLHNKGRYRFGAIAKIEELLVATQVAATKVDLGGGELLFSSPEMMYSRWASAIDEALARASQREEEVVFGWLSADLSREERAGLWEEPEIVTLAIQTTTVARPEFIGLQISQSRQMGLIKPGEILRDSFRAQLNDFKQDYLDSLEQSYERMSSLQNRGFNDNFEILFSSLHTNNNRFERVLSSAEFREALIKFSATYTLAARRLSKMSRNPHITLAESRKLQTVAQQHLMSYSIDLMGLGLTYNSTEMRNYSPMVTEIKCANRELNLLVVSP